MRTSKFLGAVCAGLLGLSIGVSHISTAPTSVPSDRIVLGPATGGVEGIYPTTTTTLGPTPFIAPLPKPATKPAKDDVHHRNNGGVIEARLVSSIGTSGGSDRHGHNGDPGTGDPDGRPEAGHTEAVRRSQCRRSRSHRSRPRQSRSRRRRWCQRTLRTKVPTVATPGVTPTVPIPAMARRTTTARAATTAATRRMTTAMTATAHPTVRPTETASTSRTATARSTTAPSTTTRLSAETDQTNDNAPTAVDDVAPDHSNGSDGNGSDTGTNAGDQLVGHAPAGSLLSG